MKISELMRRMRQAGEALKEMRVILQAEKDGGPQKKITIEKDLLKEWYLALLMLSMTVGSMEIEKIGTEKD